MLWAASKSNLVNNYLSVLVQLKSWEPRSDKSPELKTRYAQTRKSDFERGYTVEVNKKCCFKFDWPRD